MKKVVKLGGVFFVVSILLMFVLTIRSSHANYTDINSYNETSSDYLPSRPQPRMPFWLFLNPNGGVGGASISIDVGQTVPLPIGGVYRIGHTFMGWSTSSFGGSFVGSSFSLFFPGNMTLFAQWIPNNYTIHFNPGSGNGFMPSIPITFNTVATINNPEMFGNSFNKFGHSFSGWSVQPSFQCFQSIPFIGLPFWSFPGTFAENLSPNITNFPINIVYDIPCDITLIAQWIPNNYDIFFDANQGEGFMPTLPLQFNNSTLLPANEFTKKGHTFTGWRALINNNLTDFSDSSFFTQIADHDVIMSAQWQANTYTLSFNANQGVGNMNNIPIIFGDSINIPLNVFDRNEYRFDGWNTAVDGSGTTFINLDTFIQNVDYDVTLYAQWVRLDASRIPIINPVNENDRTVTGQGIAGSIINVIFPDGSTQTTTVLTNGLWEVTTSMSLNEDDLILANQTEPGKNPSSDINTIVTALNNGGNNNIYQTADGSNIILYLAMIFISLTTITFVIKRK